MSNLVQKKLLHKLARNYHARTDRRACDIKKELEHEGRKSMANDIPTDKVYYFYAQPQTKNEKEHNKNMEEITFPSFFNRWKNIIGYVFKDMNIGSASHSAQKNP